MMYYTNLSSDFTTMAALSNNIGLQLLTNKFHIKKIKEEEDKYSANDYLIKLYDNQNIMVEIKVRNKVYNELILEEKKVEMLKSKRKYYLDNGKRIDDIWYCVVVDKKIYTFSLNQIDQMEINNRIGVRPGVSTITHIDQYFRENPDSILKCNISCPRYTANNGHNYIIKSNYVIPIKYSL